jgi:acetyltransferase-like isoleucine patch superfamily enzyme
MNSRMNDYRWLGRNPLTCYLRFILEAGKNSRKFEDFQQGYMSRVLECEIEAHVRILPGAFVSKCKIGSYTYIGAESKVGHAQIGRFSSIGPGCRIGLGKHPARTFVSTSPVFYSTAGQCGSTFVQQSCFKEWEDIRIGNDVWIGANAVVSDGAQIGDGAIIAAGAIVASQVPDYAIFGGVPARLIRYRFKESAISWLKQFKWWDRDLDWIRNNCERFQDIERFIAAFKKEPDEQTTECSAATKAAHKEMIA